jgi:hypothetical protein
MAITFYYSAQSNASRIMLSLTELGIPFETVKVDLRAGDQRRPEFLAQHRQRAARQLSPLRRPSSDLPRPQSFGVGTFNAVATSCTRMRCSSPSCLTRASRSFWRPSSNGGGCER